MNRLIGQLSDGTLYISPSEEYESMGVGAVTTKLMLPDIMRKLKAYEDIGTTEEFRALKEKTEPIKAYYYKDEDEFECSNCGLNITNKEYDYCPTCGSLFGEVEVVE